jgi:hypothetical protein
MIDLETARRHAVGWCDAWNRGDLEAIMEHYADDVEINSPTIVRRLGIESGWLKGKDRLREHFAAGIRALKLRFDLVDVLAGVGSICIIYRRETGALVCDLVELDEQGRGRRVVACYGEGRSQ